MKRKLWTLPLSLGVALALCVGANAANRTKLETSHGGQTLSGGERYHDRRGRRQVRSRGRLHARPDRDVPLSCVQ